MCGFLFAKLRNSTPHHFGSIFSEALGLMGYRGRDAVGTFHENNHFFGHVRLSILDLSERSNQPVIKPNHIILFTGEIYNYKKLKGSAYSDTLAVAELVEEGANLASSLSGMYAVLAYDRLSKEIKVSRDFYGEKPVYYYVDNNIFIVSSTIKSIIYLLHKTYKITLNINSQSLYEYFLSGYIREPKTIYSNIHMLSSAHELKFSSDWQITITNFVSTALQKNVIEPYQYSIYSLQTTDVEPALLLSSGVDSTYLLDLMQENYSVFSALTYKSPIPAHDESVRALNNVKKICEPNQAQVSLIDNFHDIFSLYERYPKLLEQPSSDGVQLFNLLLMCRQINDKLKLIILGTGGDELYGGYHTFKNYNKIALLRKITFLKHLLPAKYRRFYYMRSDPADQVALYYFLYRISFSFLPYIPYSIVENIFIEFNHEMSKYQYGEMGTPYHRIKIAESFDYMRNQLLRDADNISLYCGYEARNPLLSISAYFQAPDNKKFMKDKLHKKHGIQFNKKKGFTFSDNNIILYDYLIKKINEFNSKVNILSNAMQAKLRSPQVEFHYLKKIYTLLAWLDCNNIQASQLEGFQI